MPDANDESKNILEEGLLHHAMVFFQQAEYLPNPGVYLLQVVASSLTGAVWCALGAPPTLALAAAAVVVLFSIGDLAFFHWLIRRRISFGPCKAQTVVLLVPRAMMGVPLTLLAGFLDWSLVLVVLTAAQLAASLLLGWAAAFEVRRLQLTRLDVRLDGIPAAARPVRLLHISDIHLERHTERENRLLELAREARPDLIVLTGDYLNLSYNTDEKAKRQAAQLLAQLEAPCGVYATLGSPPVDLREEIVPVLAGSPLRLLRNEWTTVEFEAGPTLVLMGVDCTHHLERDSEQLGRVAGAAPRTGPRLLLYHSPELMPQAPEHGVDLYLCGHTHGGQVRLPLIGPILTSSQLGRRYVMGHYCQGRTQLYVSRGVGLEGLSAPRVRLLAPPEITLITIRPRDGSTAISPGT